MFTVALAMLIMVPAPSAQAGLIRGLMSMVVGVLEVPRATLVGTFGGPPLVGTVFGLVNGTFRGLGMITMGAVETVGSAARLALKYGPLVPIFL